MLYWWLSLLAWYYFASHPNHAIIYRASDTSLLSDVTLLSCPAMNLGISCHFSHLKLLFLPTPVKENDNGCQSVDTLIKTNKYKVETSEFDCLCAQRQQARVRHKTSHIDAFLWVSKHQQQRHIWDVRWEHHYVTLWDENGLTLPVLSHIL